MADEDVVEVGAEEQHVEEAFQSLLAGLRLTLPGAQVLFAFLLTLPLQSAFSNLTDIERSAYFVAFYGSGIASVLLIAPSVHQRLRAPRTGMARRSARHLTHAIRVTITGTVLLALALGAAVYLAVTLTFADAAAATGAAVIVSTIGWAWFYVPLVRFASDGPDR
jgi:hypothetical protein